MKDMPCFFLGEAEQRLGFSHGGFSGDDGYSRGSAAGTLRMVLDRADSHRCSQECTNPAKVILKPSPLMPGAPRVEALKEPSKEH